jgi:hypothetical protein
MKDRTPLGTTLSPILNEIESALWDMEYHTAEKPCYTKEGFRSACKIFMSVVLDKMWELQEAEKMPQAEREKMAVKAGQAVREMVKTFCDIDTHKLYKDER